MHKPGEQVADPKLGIAETHTARQAAGASNHRHGDQRGEDGFPELHKRFVL